MKNPCCVATQQGHEKNLPSLSLLQLKRGYTGLAVRERFNHTFGYEIPSPNAHHDPAVSRKPDFKKTILQGSNCFIDQDIFIILVNGLYRKRLLDQLPLTGGEIMRNSRMRPFYVGRQSDYHFLF